MDPAQLNYLKKTLISLFIIYTLGVTIYPNLTLILHIPSVQQTGSFDRSFGGFTNQAFFQIGQLGSILAIRNTWNMFSVIDRSVWTVMITGVNIDGSKTILPLNYSSNSPFWENDFSNFREAKLFQNLYGNQFFQSQYADYLCSQFPQMKANLSQIEFDSYSQKIPSPQTGSEYKKEEFTLFQTNSYSCRN